MNTAVTLGCDPEVFLKAGNEFVSAVGLIGGSKARPRSVKDGMLQEDNVMAEFGITPSGNENDFVARIKSVLSDLEATIKPYELSLDFSPTATFAPAQLTKPECLVFGCEPDYCAWTLTENEGPDPFKVGNMRSAGGHVHVGFDMGDDEFDSRIHVVRMMDIFLGIPSVLLDPDKDRRSMYGKAGAHRPKDYGVEYRTLSNFWVQDESYMRWVYRQSMMAVIQARANPNGLIEHVGGAEVIQDTINNSRTDKAAEIVANLNLVLPVH